MNLRPLRPEDVPAAAAVAWRALEGPDPAPPERRDWGERRIAHLSSTDPGGAWVSTADDGTITGVGLALVRDGVWGLSLLAVDPEQHARGTGTALLNATLAHGEEPHAWIILSSEDPKAMRIYARAGFDLHPTMTCAGIVERAQIPAGLRARETDDVEAVAALARPVRGGAYGPHDLELLLTRPGAQLLTIDGRGFLLHLDGSPRVLAADSGGVAADLLWTGFANGPRGATVNVEFLTAGQDWAVRTCLEAGLALSAYGPVFTRGEVGTLRPWLPSGAIL